jgi:hypothetical protein
VPLEAFPVRSPRLMQPRGSLRNAWATRNRELLHTFSRLPDTFPSFQTRSTRLLAALVPRELMRVNSSTQELYLPFLLQTLFASLLSG